MPDFLLHLSPSVAIGNCIAVAASAVLVLSYQIKSLKKLVLIHALISLMYAVTFCFLGKYQGAAQNFISAAARIVSLFGDRRWAKSRIWVFVFSALYIAFGVIYAADEGIISILVSLAMVIYVFVLWYGDAFWFKVNHLAVTSPAWVVYDCMAKNYPGALTECFTMVSITVWLFRYRAEKKRIAAAADPAACVQEGTQNGKMES